MTRPLPLVATAIKTFELISKTAPDIKLCLSTNGLMLPDHVDTIKAFNVDHVTITINMVDPEIGARIYPWIFYKHKRYTGVEAARILSERTAAAGPGDADRAGYPLQGQLRDDSGRQRQTLGGSESCGQVAGRVPPQHHAVDL